MAILDHSEIYKQRLLQQYKSSLNLIGLIDALIEGQGDLEVVLDQLLNERSINTAIGAQLDIIGEIVGQPRTILDVTGLEFFGYAGAAGDIDGYGTLLDPTIGARYRSGTEETGTFRELGDAEYRLFIKSKVFKNVGSLTTENLIEALSFVFGEGSFVGITENGNHNVSLTLVADIPVSTAQLLVTNDALPRPAGVSYLVSFLSGDGLVFAFETFPLGSTYGTVTNPTIGGTFTELV
jgi:hypothetical protein